jgi:hypothetical protein
MLVSSVHDSRIWKNSVVGMFMLNSRSDALLLGDEGYGIAPWLMNPFKDPQHPHEISFNRIFTRHIHEGKGYHREMFRPGKMAFYKVVSESNWKMFQV